MDLSSNLHPSTCLIGFTIMVILLWRGWFWTIVITLSFLAMVYLYRISIRELYRKIAPSLGFVIILILISWFSTGDLIKSLNTGYKFMLLISLLSLLSVILSAFDLTYGIYTLLKPFSFFKIPVADISFVVAMTLRFIPMLSDEIERIVLSQRARGFNVHKFSHVLKVGYSVLVPVFISAIIRAEAMAISLYLRGVDVKKGIPPVRDIKFGKIDILCILGLIGLLVVSMYV